MGNYINHRNIGNPIEMQVRSQDFSWGGGVGSESANL